MKLNQPDFVSELSRNLKENNVKLTKDELNIVITELIALIHNTVLYQEEEVKINNFAKFSIGKTAQRKLPNGQIVVPREILRVKLSEKFTNKQR